uniref:Major facilitator superfamily associated domain-containing protein n=2 Tax=Dendroctonus ponderosae TaxID=77166 RepID=A0AAR5Q2E6_DENPD
MDSLALKNHHVRYFSILHLGSGRWGTCNSSRINGAYFFTDSIIYEDKKHGEKPPKVPVPKDKYLICHIVFFLIGVSHFLPISFLAAANNFWLYKFKDPLDENTSAENRTTLQTYFASATLIANTVPAFIFGLFNIIGGQKFKITNRFLLTLGIELMVFTLITISATINTDNPTPMILS